MCLPSILPVIGTEHLPTVTYMRLDGSVPAAKRQSVANTFNNDPTVDLLLLTTAVGGLGAATSTSF